MTDETYFCDSRDKLPIIDNIVTKKINSFKLLYPYFFYKKPFYKKLETGVP